ncbi:Polyketide cyclase / dehydrase and lipid transport [Nakamurella panacisegetis]|uniref:Polyketide cyclase / dehydrase and lipid transport n=1 Tax=Nakamurella panacisegetis TaxID=1090615 RepID=A0A1H0LNT6_9ACTN|nr:SRPBCC family protein [Nakamurella panacisegetis]SDO69785.1 Polyketide cyclase / dehydrase and lipid transport [Nakamurella panacisegetis]
MPHIQGEVLIRRPVEEVFDFVADERNEPTYNPNMIGAEKITPGPIGVDTRFRATVRSGRRPLPMRVRYTAFERPHLLGSTTQMAAAEFSGTLTFDPIPGGTRLRWSWQARPKGAMRLLTPVFVPIGARQERRMWTRLRDNLEADGREQSTLDRYLPDPQVSERHSRLVHAEPSAVQSAIGQLDLTGIPAVRALLVLRGLPGRLRARLRGGAPPIPAPFTVADMAGAGWIPLAPGPQELAFGTVTRPWRIGDEAPLAMDPESFTTFSAPGYAKIAFAIRTEPAGPGWTRVTTETRVCLTDPRSRRRFAAYWAMVGPFSALIRRMILRRIRIQVER